MKTLIAGIGSTILGDDGVGVEAARQCKESFYGDDSVHVVEVGTGGLSLLDIVQGYDQLIILDAIISGSPPGSIHIMTEADIARTVHLGAGHEADLVTTLTLGRKFASGSIPNEVHVVAVEVCSINAFRESLSPEVAAAVPRAVDAVGKLLQNNR